MFQRENSCCSTANFQKSLEFYNPELGPHPSITDFNGNMNTLFQKKHSRSESCITFKVSQRIQKVEIYLATERSGVAFFSTGLGRIFGRNGGKDFGVMFRGIGPRKPDFAYDIVRIHSLMIYTDLIENKIVGDTKTLLLLFSFSFTAQGWRQYNYWAVQKLTDLQ